MIEAGEYARAKELFLDAIDHPEAERETFVRSRSEDPRITEEVLRLLRRDASSHTLDEPLILAAMVLDDPEGTPAIPEIDGLRILRRIGEGGMGVVFAAEETSTGRRVALKLLRPGMATPTLAKRLRIEIAALGRLDHPNIAHILGTGVTADESGRLPYLLMELVEGDPLRAFADEHQLQPRDCIEILIRVAEALQHAHDQGVIHRDLKPSNILVTPEGDPKVLDFGVARIIDPEESLAATLTRSGQLVGTVPYMSPEQVEMGVIDPRSDVYSLGVVAYELLTGRLPYSTEACSLAEMARSIRDDAPVPASRIQPALRGDLTTILGKALEKDPRQRYISAAAFAQDLRAHLGGRRIHARPPSTLQRLQRFTNRHRALTASLSALLLALVLGLAGTLTFAFRASSSARSAARSALRAEERADEADAVRELFVGTLGWADPELARGRERTVKEALDDATKKLQTASDLAPGVEAALHLSLAKIYNSVGAKQEACEHQRRAAELQEDLHGRDSPETRKVREGLAVFLGNLNRPEEAEAILRELVETPDDLQGLALADLAHIVLQSGRLDESLELSKRAVERLREDGDSWDLVDALEKMSTAYMFLGTNREEELALAQEADETATRIGQGGSRRLRATMQLANALDDLARHEEAIALYRECLETRTDWYGEEHPQTQITAMNLGVALTRAGELEDALAVLEKVYRIYDSKLDASLGDKYLTAQNLVDLYDQLKQFDRGIAFAEGILPELPDNLQGWILHLQYGLLLDHAGRSDEAVRALREYFDRSDEALPPGHELLRLAALSLGHSLADLGRVEEAERWTERAAEIQSRQAPEPTGEH